MTDWVEVVAGDKDQKYRRAALVLRTLGWTSIVWAAGLSVWIWMGWRAGANLWLWSVIVLLAVGAVLLAIASRLQVKAAHIAASPRARNDNGMKAA
jgi:hypothetical protein